MKKKKSLLWRLIPAVLLLVVVVLLVVFVFIPIYTPKASANLDAPIVYSYTGDGKKLTMENDQLLFTLDPKTTQFTLLQKDTGYTWYSNPPDSDKDPIALKADKDKLKSTVMVTFSTTEGITTQFNNYAYSIQNGIYDVEKNENGSIDVRYTIGRVNKVYYIPIAVNEARMDEICKDMTKSEKRKATDGYRLYDPAKFKADDDVGALKAKYPGLNEGKMYILREGTAEHVKAKLAGYFEKAGYTIDDYNRDLENVVSDEVIETAVFNVTIRYSLSGGELIAEVPYDEIRYFDAYPIMHITPLPYFGAAGTDEEGYMMVPDGGGAIIKYNNGKLSQNSYYANLYGWDWAQERKQAINETRCSFPVFAMTGGGNSFICIMEGNTAFAGVQADISGRGNSYNSVSARYAVLHGDRYDVSAKTNSLVYLYEQAVPGGSAVQRYRFLPTDDYVDMALEYRAYLKEKHPSLSDVDSAEMPVTVELLGAIDKTLQRGGLPMQVNVPMTTYAEAEEIMNTLLSAGIDNLSMYYTGWANKGIQQHVLTSVYLVNELGSENDLRLLLAKARAAGVDFYLDGAVCFANDSSILDGFMAFRDAAKYTTREKVLLYPYSTIWYTPMEWRDSSYLVKPKYMLDCAKNLADAAAKFGAIGVMYRDLGSILSADYNPNDLVTREESKQIQLEALQYNTDMGRKAAVKIGNDYALQNASLITEMDYMGGRYSIFDGAIPFYQIALHGLIEYTGTPINLAGDYIDQILRCAEFGSGLNFAFMAEEATVLQNSFYSTCYGNNFSQWGEKAIEIASKYQKDMAGLQNIRITGHQMLTGDSSVTIYENGTRVYVNYGDVPVTFDGVDVTPRSYVVKGGQN